MEHYFPAAMFFSKFSKITSIFIMMSNITFTFFSQVEKDDPYKEFIILLKIKCSNFLKQNFQPKKCGYVESQNFLRNYLSFII